LNAIFPNINNNDFFYNRVKLFEKKYGITLTKHGDKKHSPKTMTLGQFHVFLAYLSEDSTYRTLVEEFSATSTYKKVLEALEGKAITSASSVCNTISSSNANANAVSAIGNWMQNMDVKQVTNPKMLSLVQDYMDTYFIRDAPQVTELGYVQDRMKQKHDDLFFILLTNSRYCRNIEGNHLTNCICFSIGIRGLRQHCFHQSENGCKSNPCENYTYSYIISNKCTELVKIFQAYNLKKHVKQIKDNLFQRLTNPFSYIETDEEFLDYVKQIAERMELELQLRSEEDERKASQKQNTSSFGYVGPLQQKSLSNEASALSKRGQEAFPNSTRSSGAMLNRGSKAMSSVQPTTAKTITFVDVDGDRCSYTAVRFAELREYIAQVFVGKRVTKITYIHDRYGELVIKDEAGFVVVQDGTEICVHYV